MTKFRSDVIQRKNAATNDALNCVGAFNHYGKGASIADETEAAERAIAKDVMKSMMRATEEK